MTSDLLDQLEAVLPRMNAAAEACQVLDVMARISRATSGAVFLDRCGLLRWVGGDRVGLELAATIKRDWRVQRVRVLSGTAFTETAAVNGDVPSRMVWMRRPVDGGLDAVYLAGPDLRPLDDCADRLKRVSGILARLQPPAAP